MEYTQIGFTKKTHGVAGELKIVIEEVFEDIFLEADRVFIEARGAKMPYFLENVRGGGELIVKFEDIDNKDQAIPLQSKPVFLPTAELPAILPVIDDGMEYSHLEGYMLINEETGPVGTIDEVVDMPQQEMAFLQHKGREVLVPLNANLIVSIDDKKKTVTLRLPDGLLDLDANHE